MKELENKIAINGHLLDRRVVLGVGLVLGADLGVASVLAWSRWLHKQYKKWDQVNQDVYYPKIYCPKDEAYLPASEQPPCPIADP